MAGMRRLRRRDGFCPIKPRSRTGARDGSDETEPDATERSPSARANLSAVSYAVILSSATAAYPAMARSRERGRAAASRADPPKSARPLRCVSAQNVS